MHIVSVVCAFQQLMTFFPSANIRQMNLDFTKSQEFIVLKPFMRFDGQEERL